MANCSVIYDLTQAGYEAWWVPVFGIVGAIFAEAIYRLLMRPLPDSLYSKKAMRGAVVFSSSGHQYHSHGPFLNILVYATLIKTANTNKSPARSSTLLILVPECSPEWCAFQYTMLYLHILATTLIRDIDRLAAPAARYVTNYQFVSGTSARRSLDLKFADRKSSPAMARARGGTHNSRTIIRLRSMGLRFRGDDRKNHAALRLRSKCSR